MCLVKNIRCDPYEKVTPHELVKNQYQPLLQEIIPNFETHCEEQSFIRKAFKCENVSAKPHCK